MDEVEQPKKKLENGTFTQIPNVFFDTCDLPETAQILYLRIYRQIGHYDGKLSGSVRKISKTLRVSKSTVQRMIKRLEESRLIIVTYEPSGEEEKQVMTITLNKQDLWALNKLHHETGSVPNWDKVMPGCPTLGQDVPGMGQDDINLGHAVPPEGHAVPGVSSNSGDNTINTLNTFKDNKETTDSPSINKNGFIEKLARDTCKELKAYDEWAYLSGELQGIYQAARPSLEDYRFAIEDITKEIKDYTPDNILSLGCQNHADYLINRLCIKYQLRRRTP